MNNSSFEILTATPDMFESVGNLMVAAYSSLEGFPNQDQMPDYYHFLQNVGKLTEHDSVKIFAAKEVGTGTILGGVLFLEDLAHYGVPLTIAQPDEVAAFRLLAVEPLQQGRGIGLALVQKCIDYSRHLGKKRLVIHSTDLMTTARKMYDQLGFLRLPSIDFNRNNIDVYGFELVL